MDGCEDLNEMLKAIGANKVGAVFVVDISRLSRQLIDFEKLRILASYHDVLLVVDGRVVNLSDPDDTVTTQLSAAFAMYENKQRIQRMANARITKARQGEIVSVLPIGWRRRGKGWAHDPEVAPLYFT